MERQPIDQLTGQPGYLKKLLMASVGLTSSFSLVADPAELNYYKSFPQVADKHHKLMKNLATTIGRIGYWAGIQTGRQGLVQLDKTVEILDALVDAVEIGVKKAQEEQQSLKVQKRRQVSKQPDQPPQRMYDLSHPDRKQPKNQLDFSLINTNVNIQPSLPLNTTPLQFIQNQAELTNLISQLTGQNQIAVDLEHSDKSYHGMTCLMQISTRSKDYIIDVFPLWKQLHQLNTIMNNPNVLKVFHGAYMDIYWLHRDFDIRICHLFDTYHAARQLGHRQHSYVYLLKHYTNTETDKKFQLADWRQRPISQQMLKYARIDTHYLLEIYDKMKADLEKKSISMQLDYIQNLKSVFRKSCDVIQDNEFKNRTFRDEQHYRTVMDNHRALKPPERVQLMDRIFEVRDSIAQQEDENVDEIFPRKFIFQLCDKKDFEESSIAQTLRKAPQKLQKYVSKIAKSLKECWSNCKKQPVKQQMEVEDPPIKALTEVKIDGEAQQMYFEWETFNIGLKPYEVKTLKNQINKANINFQQPFTYLSSLYAISKVQVQQVIQQPQEQPVEQPTEQQAKEEILYFPKEKRQREQPVQPTAFSSVKNKKQRKEVKQQQKIKRQQNNFSYLQ